MATTGDSIERAQAAIKAAVESRGAKAAMLDEVTRSLLVAFSALKDAERALAEESKWSRVSP